MIQNTFKLALNFYILIQMFLNNDLLKQIAIDLLCVSTTMVQ